MEKAVIYARFSSDKQTEMSIEAQERACRDYAAQHDLIVTEVYADEAISGKGSKTAARRQYQRLMRNCDKGLFAVILIHKYDRIARNMGEHVNLEGRLKSKGITLIAVAQDFGNSKEAKIMKALSWSMSEYYIDNLAEETRKGLREIAEKGEHTGGYPPFGYDIVDKHYAINDLEAGYVRKMFEAAQRKEGMAGLVKEMAAAGIVGKRGKPIKYPQIYEILRNEKYTGVYLYSPVEASRRADRRVKADAIRKENALPIIIEKAQFEEVQKIMDSRKQTGRKSNYMCSGMVYCRCGAKMHAITCHRKGNEYKYYTCSQKCGAPVVHVEEVDAAALRYVQQLLTPENQQKIADALRHYQAGAGSRMTEFRQALKKRMKEKQSQYDALVQNLASGVLPAEIVADMGQKMQELKAEIAMLETTEPPKDFTVDTIKAWLESIKAAPDKDAVRLLIERIDVKKDKEKPTTAFEMQSTLKAVVGINGCGGAQHILPEILFRFLVGCM